MKQLVREKRLEYSLYLNKQLSKNATRIIVEKDSFQKLLNGFSNIQTAFKNELETQMQIIEKDEKLDKISKQEE